MKTHVGGLAFDDTKPGTFSAPYHGGICKTGVQHWEPGGRHASDEVALIVSLRDDLHRFAGEADVMKIPAELIDDAKRALAVMDDDRAAVFEYSSLLGVLMAGPDAAETNFKLCPARAPARRGFSFLRGQSKKPLA